MEKISSFLAGVERDSLKRAEMSKGGFELCFEERVRPDGAIQPAILLRVGPERSGIFDLSAGPPNVYSPKLLEWAETADAQKMIESWAQRDKKLSQTIDGFICQMSQMKGKDLSWFGKELMSQDDSQQRERQANQAREEAQRLSAEKTAQRQAEAGAKLGLFKKRLAEGRSSAGSAPGAKPKT